MIEVKAQKVYKVELSIRPINEDMKIFEMFESYLLTEEQGKNTDASVIFDWLAENTRKFVPFKKVNNSKPSFRVGFNKYDRNKIWVVAYWELANAEVDLLYIKEDEQC